MTAPLIIAAALLAWVMFAGPDSPWCRRSSRTLTHDAPGRERQRPARHAAHRSGIATTSRSPGANSDERQARAQLRPRTAHVTPHGVSAVRGPESLHDELERLA